MLALAVGRLLHHPVRLHRRRRRRRGDLLEPADIAAGRQREGRADERRRCRKAAASPIFTPSSALNHVKNSQIVP
ncbi:hypothetical protein JCM18382A_23630 [Bradyrhizobium sp. 17-4]